MTRERERRRRLLRRTAAAVQQLRSLGAKGNRSSTTLRRLRQVSLANFSSLERLNDDDDAKKMQFMARAAQVNCCYRMRDMDSLCELKKLTFLLKKTLPPAVHLLLISGHPTVAPVAVLLLPPTVITRGTTTAVVLQVIQKKLLRRRSDCRSHRRCSSRDSSGGATFSSTGPPSFVSCLFSCLLSLRPCFPASLSRCPPPPLLLPLLSLSLSLPFSIPASLFLVRKTHT